MNPGRELDALIAEKVMGWKLKETMFGPSWVDSNGNFTQYDDKMNFEAAFMFRPSTEIAAAWLVVEKIGNGWILEFVDAKYGVYKGGRDLEDGIALAEAPTAPHAICLAALKTLDC